MLSFIVPAYNEGALIGATIDSIRAAAEAVGEPHEIIVVNDASTDRTADVARARGSRVIDVHKRHIAAVRNAGASAARGDVLVFVDADTLLPSATLRDAIRALNRGAVGGGSAVELEGRLGFVGWLWLKAFLMCWRPLGLAAGCFVFARRGHFEAVGGFDERYFASEEIWFSLAMKRRGRFVIVRHPVISSGRKVRMHSAWDLTKLSFRLLLGGPKFWQKRENLDLWYDGRREAASPPSFSGRPMKSA